MGVVIGNKSLVVTWIESIMIDTTTMMMMNDRILLLKKEVTSLYKRISYD